MSGSQEPFMSLLVPPGFRTIEQIDALPNDLIKAGTKINVIGFVKDYQPPIKTKGTDYKCTLTLVDQSSLPTGLPTLAVSIFWSLDRMPIISGASDAILIRNAKVQMWAGNVSLLANNFSEFHILPSSKIPSSFPLAGNVPWIIPSVSTSKRPTLAETTYVINSYSSIKDLGLPTKQDFEVKSRQAANGRDKFSLLKDVKLDSFYNILGQVIRVFDAHHGVAVYVSDYTANSEFYNYEWAAASNAITETGEDIYCYKRQAPKASSEWPGPYGKFTIQLMLFDAHGEFVRENVKVGQWIFLRNVRVKYSKEGGILEGALHTDQLRGASTVLVDVLDPFAYSDTTDMGKRLKDAVGRKLACEKKFKAQRQAILDEAAGLSKRKRDEDEPLKKNSKQRRQERRAAAERKAAGLTLDPGVELESNPHIRCAHSNQPVVPLADILKPRSVVIDGQDYPCSLNTGKFRAIVRVVDFFPNEIESFAVGRRASEYDLLSDYSGGEDTNLEEDMRNFRGGKGYTRNTWEWRFALQVEDAHPKRSKGRLWVIVDNLSAQYLLGLEEDATNLREKPKLLGELKEQLFKLWGDLEETKPTQAIKERKKPEPPPPSSDVIPSGTSMELDDQPNPDSDSDEEIRADLGRRRDMERVETEDNISKVVVAQESRSSLTPNNEPFVCCIEQYLIKVNEPDPAKATAMNGKRWQNMFKMFETQIS